MKHIDQLIINPFCHMMFCTSLFFYRRLITRANQMKRSADDIAEAQHAAKMFKTVCDALEMPVEKKDVYKIIADVYERQETTPPAAPTNNMIPITLGVRCVIYVLKLQGNRYYVGRSDSDAGVNLRIEAHKNGTGSAWTIKNKYISEWFRKHDCTSFEEDSITLQLMHQMGVERVRGGSYCNEVLMPHQERAIKDQLCTALSACFKCSRQGHCKADCPY